MLRLGGWSIGRVEDGSGLPVPFVVRISKWSLDCWDALRKQIKMHAFFEKERLGSWRSRAYHGEMLGRGLASGNVDTA